MFKQIQAVKEKRNSAIVYLCKNGMNIGERSGSVVHGRRQLNQ